MNNEKQLEKSVWYFKTSKEDNLYLQNIELELNVFEQMKYELNVIYYESGFDPNIEKLFIYNVTEDNKEEKNKEGVSDDFFFSKYYHFLIVGKCELSQEEKPNLLFKIDKIITNEYKPYLRRKNIIDEKKANFIESSVDSSFRNIVLSKSSFINDIVGIKSEIALENMG